MNYTRKIALISLILFILASHATGKTSNDSMQVTIHLDQAMLLNGRPRLALQKLNEENRTFINPVVIQDNQAIFRFPKDKNFLCIFTLEKSGKHSRPIFISADSKDIRAEAEMVEGSPLINFTKHNGSKAQDNYVQYDRLMQAKNDSVDLVMQKKHPDYQQNYERQDIVNERFQLYNEADFRIFKKLIHDKNFYQPLAYWLLQNAFETFSVAQLKQLLLPAPAAEAQYYFDLVREDLKIKEQAMNDDNSRKVLFSNPDIEKFVSASNKKFVYITFWASWCAPCRHHNNWLLSSPLKNADIIAVSLDAVEADWKEAITHDKIQNWKHTQLKQGIESEIVKTFNFKAIPASILLDSARKIIGVNITDEELNLLINKAK